VPDEDDRPRDAAGAADSNWPVGAKGGIDWTQISAPDDLSGLGRDVKSYHRECRATRRRERWHRLSARPSTAPLTMTATALVMAAVVALLLTVMAPGRSSSGPRALVLNDLVTTTTGQTGGLLPSASLTSAATDRTLPAFELRPAAVVLIPVNCNCTAFLNKLAAAAYAAHRTGLAVITPATDAEAKALVGQLTSGRAAVYQDTYGQLSTGLDATGITLALLDRDGILYGPIVRSVTPTTNLNITDNLNKMLAAKGTSG
jgi:hypothetical protein